MKLCVLIASTALVSSLASAQEMSKEELDETIALMRANVRHEKSRWVEANLPLDEKQSAVFWPIYRRYERELTRIGDDRLALIEEYAENHESLTDIKAQEFLDKSLEIEDRYANARKIYKNEFLRVLPAKVVARFFQVDYRLNLIIDLEVASQIPLVQ